jgi:hypothetical protein
VITQVIMFTVIYGLYEISIVMVKMVDKKREAQLREDGFYDDEEDEDAPEAKPKPVKAKSAKAEKEAGPILEIIEDDDDFEAAAFDDDNKPT